MLLASPSNNWHFLSIMAQKRNNEMWPFHKLFRDLLKPTQATKSHWEAQFMTHIFRKWKMAEIIKLLEIEGSDFVWFCKKSQWWELTQERAEQGHRQDNYWVFPPADFPFSPAKPPCALFCHMVREPKRDRSEKHTCCEVCFVGSASLWGVFKHQTENANTKRELFASATAIKAASLFNN